MPVKCNVCGLVNSFFNSIQFNLIPNCYSLQCAIRIHPILPKESVLHEACKVYVLSDLPCNLVGSAHPDTSEQLCTGGEGGRVSCALLCIYT